MARFKKTTAKTMAAHLKEFSDYISGMSPNDIHQDLVDRFNDWMDELLGEDFFGTEGQCDPRGDHRN